MKRRSVMVIAGVGVAALVLAVAWTARTIHAPQGDVRVAPTPAPARPAPDIPTSAFRQAGSLTPWQALAAFESAFVVQAGEATYYKLTTAGGTATLFKQVEMMEMVEDAYAKSHRSAYASQLASLFSGLVLKHGRDWMHIPSSDDLMWSAVMCLRAYELTGDTMYLQQARSTFDQTYARAYDGSFGGGLWNTIRRRSKNTCVTAPAVIAAGKLYQVLHEARYLRIATGLFGWLRARLYDPRTGAVYDRIFPSSSGKPVLDKKTYTYNQGGFIGAGDVLFSITRRRAYYRDALKALQYARNRLTVHGILKSEAGRHPGPFVSAGGFKGMFVRWAWRFVADHHLVRYQQWFRQNARTARRSADARGLIGENWLVRTPPDSLLAFSCSSAVVLLIAVS